MQRRVKPSTALHLTECSDEITGRDLDEMCHEHNTADGVLVSGSLVSKLTT